MKPPLPHVCTHCDVRSPVFHWPDISHSFADQSIRYCLIKRTKSRVDIVHKTSFYKIKNEMISTYSAFVPLMIATFVVDLLDMDLIPLQYPIIYTLQN